MQPIDRLIEATQERKVKIAVVGDSLRDVWVHGELLPSQDGCAKFDEHRRVETPGGAAGAARQLFRWNADAHLIALAENHPGEAWNQLSFDYALECRRMPVKLRYIDASGRIVFRADDDRGYGLDAEGVAECRKLTLLAMKGDRWDAVLISDYDKGFLDGETIHKIIETCNAKGIPIVADAKRVSSVYAGAVLKCNADYVRRYGMPQESPYVVTDGSAEPCVSGTIYVTCADPLTLRLPTPRKSLAVQCVNHVGAGDCFSAHLTLALAHGLNLEDAAQIAHSAGRVYVQHAHGRPPWPHEIRRDLDPVGGKVIPSNHLAALRKSIPGRIGFTNGCFRTPHAGHASMLQWAKAQGDVLVVGVNSDASTRRLKDGYCMPAHERVAVLASMQAVDWVIVFDEDTPYETIKALKPDLIVKGSEYAGQEVVGSDLAEVRFAPMVQADKPARRIAPVVHCG